MDSRDAAPPVQGPIETSPFFSLLNRDIRNLIYNYMTLGQLRNKDAVEWAGYRGTCRQAKKEAEEEGVRHLWMYVQDICGRNIKKTGCDLRLPRQLKKMDDFVGLKELTLITNAPADTRDSPNGHCSCKGLGDLLSIEINDITFHYTSQQPPSNPEDMAEAALLTLSCLANSRYDDSLRMGVTPDSFHNSAITVSWDYRNCTREDEYESLPTYQLKKELRNRGVKSEDMPHRKPAVIDALLAQDVNNPDAINATDVFLATGLPQTLVGKHAYLGPVGGSLDTSLVEVFGANISPFHADTSLFNDTPVAYADTSLFYATNCRNSVEVVRLEEMHDGFGVGMCESLIENVLEEIRSGESLEEFVLVETSWNGVKYD